MVNIIVQILEGTVLYFREVICSNSPLKVDIYFVVEEDLNNFIGGLAVEKDSNHAVNKNINVSKVNFNILGYNKKVRDLQVFFLILGFGVEKKNVADIFENLKQNKKGPDI